MKNKEAMKESCKKKDCEYWRDTPLGDSHYKCMTCCHSAWRPKSDKDNYKPNTGVERQRARGAEGSGMKHAETWSHIVAACKSETQSSINVGGNRRREAIVEADWQLTRLLADRRELAEQIGEMKADLQHAVSVLKGAE